MLLAIVPLSVSSYDFNTCAQPNSNLYSNLYSMSSKSFVAEGPVGGRSGPKSKSKALSDSESEVLSSSAINDEIGGTIRRRYLSGLQELIDVVRLDDDIWGPSNRSHFNGGASLTKIDDERLPLLLAGDNDDEEDECDLPPPPEVNRFTDAPPPPNPTPSPQAAGAAHTPCPDTTGTSFVTATDPNVNNGPVLYPLASRNNTQGCQCPCIRCFNKRCDHASKEACWRSDERKVSACIGQWTVGLMPNFRRGVLHFAIWDVRSPLMVVRHTAKKPARRRDALYVS